jgi:hypothetical protein
LLITVFAISIILVGCGVPGDPGSSYLAIEWTSAPQAMYFPAFPQIITAGEYVQHTPGTYQGEYIAWDGSYWDASYWIEVDPGEEAPLFGTGDHGDDYYLSMWLFATGPSLYTDSIVARSVADSPDSARSHVTTIQTDGTVPQPILDARLATAGVEPVEVTASGVVNGYRITVRARGWEVGR